MPKRILTLVTLVAIQAQAAKAPKPLTRAELLAGFKYPERRAFPLNAKAKPCDDFYAYVCSKTVDPFKLPSDQPKWSFSFTENSERLLHARKKFLASLERRYQPTTRRGRALRDFYAACMNARSSAREERQLVERELTKLSAIQTRDPFLAMLSREIDSPENAIVNFGSIPDQDDPTRYSLVLWTGYLTYPEKSYYEQADNVAALKGIATEFFKALGLDQPEKRAQDVVDFETQLAKVSPSSAEWRERINSRNDVKRASLDKTYPNLRLARFLERVPEHVKVRLPAPEMMKYASEALGKLPVESLKNVYLFHSARDFMDDAYEEFRNRWVKFSHKQLGTPEKRRPRPERCAQEMDSRFSKELDAELLPILFKDFPRAKAETLVAKVRASLLTQIRANVWLEEKARAEAAHKIDSAAMRLVAPKVDADWDFNPEADYLATNPYGNRKLHKRLLIEKELAELGQPRNRDRWEMGPLTLNAYYMSMDNNFTLLQGILQVPFFDAKGDETENLAAIGTVTGHELGHAIDDQGSKYDADGKMRNWFSRKDAEEFRRRGQLFVQQFNAIGHDGQLTLGENLADHVGVTAAYAAAFPENKGSVEAKKRFFVAYARMWCEKVLPKFAETLRKVDPHSAGYARVNEQVKHQDGFYEAYGCKAGDKLWLEPSARLRVW